MKNKLHSFLEYITEDDDSSSDVRVKRTKKVKYTPEQKSKMSKQYNEGQKFEKRIIAGLGKKGMGGAGTSTSGRGSDATVNIKQKPYKMEIKGDGSAFGQIKYTHHPNTGWHYHSEDAPKIADALHSVGIHGEMNAHFGEPSGSSTQHHIKHIRGVVGKRGELHSEIAGSPEKLAHFLHKTMNHNDIVHIQGKGTYSLTTDAEKRTGIPHIAKHIDSDAAKNGEVLSVRHRIKVHSKSKGNYSLTAQVNMNKEHLSTSHIDLEQHGLGWGATKSKTKEESDV